MKPRWFPFLLLLPFLLAWHSSQPPPRNRSEPPSSKPIPAAKSVAEPTPVSCEKQGESYYLTRKGDGQRLGLGTDEASCEAAIEASRSGVICTPGKKFWTLTVIATGARLGRKAEDYERDNCFALTESAHGGVVCTYTDPTSRLGPDNHGGVGWRPTNIQTGVALGRWVVDRRDDCLKITKASQGGIVCTNTRVGWKPTNIQTHKWCGSSIDPSRLDYCLQATAAARNQWVCSYPSEGGGRGNGWKLTRITSDCHYQGEATSLASCNAQVARAQ